MPPARSERAFVRGRTRHPGRCGQTIHHQLRQESDQTRGSPGFVPTAERIAVFDNDGTLWSEQPIGGPYHGCWADDQLLDRKCFEPRYPMLEFHQLVRPLAMMQGTDESHPRT